MSMTVLDLLLHPVRLRIVNALAAGRTSTTSQLCVRLPDISQATLYRHVGLLVSGGLLEVDGERQVRGAVEKRYRLSREHAQRSTALAHSMSLEDHRHLFAAAMAALIGEFNGYLARGDADPYADSVGYRQLTVWLGKGELASLVRILRVSVVKYMANTASRGRRPYLLSAILFPSEQGSSRVGERPLPQTRKRRTERRTTGRKP